MDNVVAIIKTHINDKKVFFVFPSEIVNNFWRKYIIKYLDIKLIRLKQFISWDQFKNTCIIYPDGKQPVNDRERLLFLNHLLDQNKTQNFFKAVISPAYAEHSPVFMKKFMGILPFLNNLECIDKISRADIFNAVKLQDLILLKKRYLAFLDANHLYEPNYQIPQLKTDNCLYYLLFPEILNDYSILKPFFSGNMDIKSIHLKDLSKPGKKPVINVFENSLFEIHWVFGKIEELLDNGIEPENISITVSNLTEVEEYLKISAEIYSIPLYIHSGKPITSYKEILFLNQIKECYQYNFSVNQVKKFVLNRSLPWKNHQITQKLVSFGIKYSCIQEKKVQEDKWLINFKKAALVKDEFSGCLEEMERFYKNLNFRINALFAAKDFSELHKRIREFINAFFKNEIWTTDKYRVFQYSLDLLNELEITTRNLSNIELINPYLTWLRYLEEKQYVKETFSYKIPVYPYRVSAGIFTDYHFIINTTQKGTKYIIRNYPFLSINEETYMEAPEIDLSELYLRLYACSGKEVFFTFAKKSFQDSNIIPGFFISDGEINYITNAVDPLDVYKKEQALWSGDNNIEINRIHSIQAKSIARAFNTFFLQKGSNYTQVPVSGATLNLLLEKRLKREDVLRISPSGLEQYIQCPFAYLLYEVIGTKEQEYNVIMIDHRNIGNIIHKIFEEFYLGLNVLADSVIDPGKRDFYRELMQVTCSKVFSSCENEAPLPVSACWKYIKKKTTDYAFSFIEVELEAFRGFKTTNTEHGLDLSDSFPGVKLYGKIDRISEDAGGLAVIDYKKRSYPSRNAIFSDNPVSFQMPFYIYLLEQERKKQVKIAAYYITELGQYQYVISESGKAMATREELDTAIDYMKRCIAETSRSILNGNFTLPKTTDQDTCRFCSYRAVCRIKFVTG